MRRLSVLLSLLALSEMGAMEVKEVTWKDLQEVNSSGVGASSGALTFSQYQSLKSLMALREELALHGGPPGPLDQKEQQLRSLLDQEGIDTEWYLANPEAVIEPKVAATGISGSDIRIPGFMLPLEKDQEIVRSFLLVPWVGACIHEPTPSAHQMIYVEVPEGMVDRGHFDPIWIEGRIDANPSSHDLFLVDGSKMVDAHYTLTTNSISEFIANAPDAIERLGVTAPTGGASWWQRLRIWGSQRFTRTMSELRDGTSLSALVMALLVAFSYGVIHTLGPGHGKAVVISFFVGEGGSLWRGVKMGFLIALFHVLSAVIVIWLFDIGHRQVTGQAPSDFQMIRLGSYGVMTLIGAYLLVAALRSRNQRKQLVQGHHSEHGRHDHEHEHEHEHEPAGHHEHHHGCGACQALEQSASGSISLMALAVGSIPCTGAILVLLFGLANNILGSAILMVFAISLGMALAMSALGIAALMSRNALAHKLTGSVRNRFEGMTRIGSALLVLGIGLSLFALSLG